MLIAKKRNKKGVTVDNDNTFFGIVKSELFLKKRFHEFLLIKNS
jgi:hypothetical protein